MKRVYNVNKNKKLHFFFAIIIICCVQANQALAQDSLNEQQIILHKITENGCKKYDKGKNDIQKSDIYDLVNKQRKKFGQKINWQFSNWEGQITSLSTNQGGSRASIEITSKYNGYAISFIQESILGFGGIHKGSSVYNELRNLQEGDPVIFSGKLEKGERGIDESSLTEQGSICSPEYSIELTNIKLNKNQINRTSDNNESSSFVGRIIDWAFNHWVITIIIIVILGVLNGIGKSKRK